MRGQVAIGADLEAHPAAAIFPLLGKDEHQQLVDDIRVNGLIHPGVEHEGLLLDGRNRQRACKDAGVTFRVVPWDQRGGSPLAFVVAQNLRRRHLDAGQRGVIGDLMTPLLEEERRARRLAPLKRGGTRPVTAAPAVTGNRHERTTAAEIARLVGVSERTIESVRAVRARDPGKIALVAAGELSISKAEHDLRMDDRRKAAREYTPPTGEYSVIVADPPWKYDVRADDETHRGRITYPPMETDAICAFKVPAAADCILFLWCTNSHLVEGHALRVVEAWGFLPKTIWTWCKVWPDGDQRMVGGSWGRGGTEHVIVATRGKPVGTFTSTVNWFTAPRPPEHSSKPPEFFQRVEACCPHPAKIELFARAHRAGWTTSGSDLGLLDPPTGIAAGPAVETSAPRPRPRPRPARGPARARRSGSPKPGSRVRSGPQPGQRGRGLARSFEEGDL